MSASRVELFRRDLEWAVTSPSLIDSPAALGPQTFDSASVDLEALRPLVPSNRVGRWFEQLIRFWLVEVRDLELLDAGRQIRKNGRTLGELDFVYRELDGTTVHLETAVKFFLHVPGRGGSELPGPNTTDTYERKVRRLFEHQLPMGRRITPEPDRSAALVRGRIFRPLGSNVPVVADRLAGDSLRGTWLRVSELDRLVEEHPDSRIRITAKPHWLAPRLDLAAHSTAAAARLLARRFDGDRRATMATLHDPADDRTLDHLCIVADDWDR